jgi:molybdopterin-guanine dinucleotide biosynthesis protein A
LRPGERLSLAGVVLAGGASSRFGRNKAEEVWRGRTLLDWSVAALDPLCGAVFVSGQGHAGRESVADRPRPGLGPLGGLAGAMTTAHDRGYTRILSLPCDTPQLPEGLLTSLIEQDLAYVTGCPVIGIWPTAEADRLAGWLADGQSRSVRAWAEAVGAKPLDPGVPIININRLDDLTNLETR